MFSPELFSTPVHSQLRHDGLKLRQFHAWEIFTVAAESHYFILKHRGSVKIQVVSSDFWGGLFLYWNSHLRPLLLQAREACQLAMAAQRFSICL